MAWLLFHAHGRLVSDAAHNPLAWEDSRRPGYRRILDFDIPAKAPRGKLKARVVIDGRLKAPSGFAIGPDGDLYVAERMKQRVRRFSAKGGKKGTFIDGLPDMPEFLVHVPDRP